MSFNCKNVKTCGALFADLPHYADIVLLQETWLFTCELPLLNELHTQYTGIGKSVDMDNPLEPIKMPRGFGGVAVLWKKDIDRIIRGIDDGNCRIQCIELNTEHPLVIISVYLPTKGNSNSTDELCECLDQMYEIVQKYNSTHDILIGGDLNEEIFRADNTSRRVRAIKDFMADCDMETSSVGPTFTDSYGVEKSELDYILRLKTPRNSVSQSTRLSDLVKNVSDHYPVACEIHCTYTENEQLNNTTETKTLKVKWDKVDLDLYQAFISDGMKTIEQTCESIVNPTIRLEKKIDMSSIMFSEAATLSSQQKRKSGAIRPALSVWNEDISSALKQKREAYKQWKLHGYSSDPENPLTISKKAANHQFRKQIRMEIASRKSTERLKLMETRTRDTKLFYQLINKQRNRLHNCVDDLNVANKLYSGDNVIDGFRDHFTKLANPCDNPNFDEQHRKLVDSDYDIVMELAKHNKTEMKITPEIISEAVKSINKGKSSDVFHLTIENIVNAGDDISPFICDIVQEIVNQERVPDMLKTGLITPIFKNKGSMNESKNYRGITVLPVILKVVEFVLRAELRSRTDHTQNPLQRGFTRRSSPLNCALIMEEFLNHCKDLKKTAYIVMLDGKSAFDVVVHSNMMRKLFNIGIDDSLWSLINDIHTNTNSRVKLNGKTSNDFAIYQGVRQGGNLSSDLYKIYLNPLLNRLQSCGIGGKIGNVNISAPACADDVSLCTDNITDAQILTNIATDYSNTERYELQVLKSVLLKVEPSTRSKVTDDPPIIINGNNIKTVESAVHLGITRSTSKEKTLTETIHANVKKARRTCYSLMSAGFHGHNGLNPETTLHLTRIYVLPTLLYGLEILVPKGKHLQILDNYLKSLLKQQLHLPKSTADPVIFILSGLLPVEAQLDIQILTFFNNICNHSESSIEKKLAQWQLLGHCNESSWFMDVRKILIKYDLPSADELLTNPPKKIVWKRQVKSTVTTFWKEKIIQNSKLYPTLQDMNLELYTPGKIHPLIQTKASSIRDTMRLAVKLKLVTGTYILQSNRAKFNEAEVNPTCLMCGNEAETTQHFLIDCTTLQNKRQPMISNIGSIYHEITHTNFDTISKKEQVKVILDPSFINNNCKTSSKIQELEFQNRRLCYLLHCTRHTQLLDSVPRA